MEAGSGGGERGKGTAGRGIVTGEVGGGGREREALHGAYV